MIVDKTRELVIKAKLYVLYNETPPIAAAYYSAQYSSRDQENQTAVNRNNQQDKFVTLGGKKYNTTPSFFKNITPILNSHLPPINTEVGAPRCTFSYGSLEPGVAHPNYNLLKGPTEGYAPNFLEGAGLQKNEGPTYVQPTNRELSVPYMPYSTSNAFGASKVLTSYNIWALVDENGNLKKTDSIKYSGQYFEGNNDPSLTVKGDPNGGEAHIIFNSPAAKSTIKRIFPLSKDVIYDNDSTLYVAKSTKDSTGKATSTIIQQKVTERGGENNSFHLTIAPTSFSNNQNGYESKIIVTVGNASKKYNNVAYQFEIKNSSQVELYLITAGGQKLKQNLNYYPAQSDNVNIKTNTVDIYMHFLKDIVLLGFTPNPQQWQNLSPISQEKNLDSVKNKFIHYLPSDATITVQCNYASCALQYSALIFNNYDPRSEDSTPHVTFTHETSSPSFTFDPYDGYKKVKDSGVSHYADSRAPNSQLEFVDSYVNNGYGQVKYNTVIGGPLLSKIENKLLDNKGKPTYSMAPDNSLLLPIGGQDPNKLPAYDISEYVETWSVDYQNGANNLIFSTAKVTLKNFDAGYSQDTKYNGMNILSLIEKNMIVIELSAGYNDELYIFFQGFIKGTVTNRSASGSNTILDCSDVGKEVLENTRFQNYVLFSGSKIKYAIYRCFEHSGFYPYFRLYENPGYIKSIDAFMSYTQLDNQLVQAKEGQPVIESLSIFLNEYMTKQAEMPFLRFDYSRQVFEMDWRYTNKYRDELKLFGIDLTDANTREAYFKENLEDWHGLLSGGFTVSTDNGQFYKSYEARGFGYEGFSVASASYSQKSGKDAIVSGDYNVQGFVGFDKKYYKSLNQLFPDRLAVETYLKNIIDIAKKPNYNVQFSCYVKRPLNAHGSFIIKSMMKDNAKATDAYLYTSLSYECDKKNNLIKATVTGTQATKPVK
jgi:hypothetical protein